MSRADQQLQIDRLDMIARGLAGALGNLRQISEDARYVTDKRFADDLARTLQQVQRRVTKRLERDREFHEALHRESRTVEILREGGELPSPEGRHEIGPDGDSFIAFD